MIVYTAYFGDTHALAPFTNRSGLRGVCFTDHDVPNGIGWEIVKMPVRWTPHLTSRWVKTHPHELFPREPEFLYIDSNCRYKCSDNNAVRIGDFVTFKHRSRTRITDEAEEIIRIGKAPDGEVRRQLAYYKEQGFDTDDNPQTELSECGMIYRRNTPEVRALNEAWFGEVRDRGRRDQMSIDYCAWRLGVKLRRFAGTVRRNKYMVMT